MKSKSEKKYPPLIALLAHLTTANLSPRYGG